MNRADTSYFTNLMLQNLRELPSFQNEETRLSTIEARAKKALTYTVGGHDKKLTRFAKECGEIFSLTPPTEIKPDVIEKAETDYLREKNKYLTVLHVFVDNYTSFEDTATWTDQEKDLWREACTLALRLPVP